MQYNIDDLTMDFAHLLELVAHGETVVIAKDGAPVAELVPYGKRGIRLGEGIGNPLVREDALKEDGWWHAMNEEEAADFLEGK